MPEDLPIISNDPTEIEHAREKYPWSAPDLTDAEKDEVHTAWSELSGILPINKVLFRSHDDIANLTFETAMEVMRFARRTLLSKLMMQEFHEHMLDDCGDYLEAATANWNYIWNAYWENDGDRDTFVTAIKEWLQDADSIGGCDGEIRLDIVSEELADLMYYPES